MTSVIWTPSGIYQRVEYSSEADLEKAILQVQQQLFGPYRIYLDIKKKIGRMKGIRNIPDGYLIDLSGRLPQHQPQGLSQRNLRRLLRAVHASRNLRDVAMLEVLVGAGLRVGELLALQVGDVEIGERSGKLTVWQSKHGGYRDVPLTRDVRHALTRYLEQHPEREVSSAALWLGTRGPLSNRSSVVRILDKYAYQAQIDPVKPHALRHTFATRYLEANPNDLRGLAALLGHANLNTVMIYTEPRLGDLAERMERVESRN